MFVFVCTGVCVCERLFVCVCVCVCRWFPFEPVRNFPLALVLANTFDPKTETVAAGVSCAL